MDRTGTPIVESVTLIVAEGTDQAAYLRATSSSEGLFEISFVPEGAGTLLHGRTHEPDALRIAVPSIRGGTMYHAGDVVINPDR